MLGGAHTCWGARSCRGVRVRVGRCAFVFGGARACVGGHAHADVLAVS
jgi:hypothetical protein